MPVSAATRRAQERVVFDAFLAACPTREVMATIGNKWAALAINALSSGAMRHSALMRRIAGASQKMLTQTLRTLERDGIVTRHVEPTVPVTVKYELTALGLSLVPVLSALKQWSEANIEQVLAARDDYDSARDLPKL